MRKTAPLLAAAALTVSLAACASTPNAAAPTPDTAARAKIADADILTQMTF